MQVTRECYTSVTGFQSYCHYCWYIWASKTRRWP